ncbi:MAG: hypothetical protein EZS28_052398, partial [Streblomastix strix]
MEVKKKRRLFQDKEALQQQEQNEEKKEENSVQINPDQNDSNNPQQTNEQIQGERNQAQKEKEDASRVERGQLAKRAPCGHMFHEACIKEWMLRQPTCPICRVSLFKKKERANADQGRNNQVNQRG